MTRELHVLVPGLWPKNAQPPGTPTPRTLARLLGRGHREPSASAGWESEVAALLGFRQPLKGLRRWLALPAALTPGMNDLVATPVVDLTAEQRLVLWDAAAPELERAGAVRAQAFPGLDLLLMDDDGRWEGPPPSSGMGRPMRALRLDSPIMRRLQVLGNALQMTWFDHPVNRERSAAGQLPVQGLWLWSPGIPGDASQVARIAGGGLIARWLAEQVSVPWSADPLDADADLTVIDAFLQPDLETRREGLLLSLAEDVLQPRIDRMRRDGRRELVLHDPGVARVRLGRADWRRFWRRDQSPARFGAPRR